MVSKMMNWVSPVENHHGLCCSTTIEFYDFYIYATAAVSVFHRFSSGGDAQTALLASMATWCSLRSATSGSIIFGIWVTVSDEKSRSLALVTMGLATFIIGLLPTYFQIGLWAPAMLTIIACQGPPWRRVSGAALLVTETAKPGKRATAAMWPQLGAPLGFLLPTASLVLTLAFAYNSPSTLRSRLHRLVWRCP